MVVSKLRSAIVFIAMIGSLSAQSWELRIIAPNIPPHFDDQGKGRIGDVITAVLKHCGHTVKFTIVPFGRHWHNYQEISSFDGLATAEADQTFPGYTTKAFIHLQDGATVVIGKGLNDLKNLDELAGKHIVAFPNAPRILGIEDKLERFKSFRELTERIDQVRLLLSGRADAIFADGLITAHFIFNVREQALAGNEPDLHILPEVLFRRIFTKGPQRLYFRERVVADQFDDAYAELLSAGKIERLTRPYIEKYSSIVRDQYPLY